MNARVSLSGDQEMPFGGIYLANSDNNLVRRNQVIGNGSVWPTAPCAASSATADSNNDYGLALIATSTGNLIEANSISGNTNGVLFIVG